ncbi:DDE-type integrase/transposase/recombinase [Streptomyces sp. NPDC048362]|uniref:DDE-type integrase/transposase/recombinase n=1 Tax=Streptomyces sp. NPDC048362 TaxID=3365539 RepID=UPI00372189B2
MRAPPSHTSDTASPLSGRHRRRRHRTTIPDPHTRWCGDITYIATEEGWLYLATVIDTASRRIVGWATAKHLRTELVADALTPAARPDR